MPSCTFLSDYHNPNRYSNLQTEEGLSCFIVPRWIPQTGERNRGLAFLRLKDKLGDHSNASSEIEYRDAWGQMLGEPGQGIATILQMVHHTRSVLLRDDKNNAIRRNAPANFVSFPLLQASTAWWGAPA